MTLERGDVTVREYRAKPGAGWKAAMFIGGGALFLLMLVAQVVLLFAAKPGATSQMMPGIIGGMSVVGIGMIARGTFLLRGVRRVMAGDESVVIEGFTSRAEVRWADVVRIERVKRSPLLGGESVPVMVLMGEGDRVLANLPGTVEGFEDLWRVAEERTGTARGRVTFDAGENEARQRAKAARKMKWTAVGFAVFTLGMGAGFVAGMNEEIHERRFKAEGVTVPAKVVKRYMVSVTPRVAYSFVDGAGREHSNEVMMSQEGYAALAGERVVAVEYLPSDPGWNRLVTGRSPEDVSFGGKFLFVTGGGFLVFGFLFVITALGFDLRSENGRTTLVRRGRVLREWGKVPARSVGIIEPPAPPPVPTFSPAPSPVVAPGRPVGIVGLGVLCIVFGLAGVVLAGVRALIAAKGTIELPDGRAFVTAMPVSLWVWNIGDGLLAVMLAAAGVALVRLRRFGRSLALVAAGLQVLSSVGELVLVISEMSPVEGDHGAVTLASNAGAVIGKLLGVVFPIVVLVVLGRRRVASVLK